MNAATGVLANDHDTDKDALKAVLVNAPTHGTLVLNTDGSFRYTPAANYFGSDSFTYQANDGTANSSVVTVTLTVPPVNRHPVAVSDNFTVAEDGTVTGNVLTNDSDADGDRLTIFAVNGVAVTPVAPATIVSSRGTLTMRADGSTSYTPGASSDAADDTFTYTVSDGRGGARTATVKFTITQHTGVNVSNGVMRIGGTNGSDLVVNISGNKIYVNGVARSLTAVNDLRIWGRGGDDLIDLSGLGSSIKTFVSGGAGNDLIVGGKGDDVLIGGAGLDLICGGAGNDVLVGGQGSDLLWGDDGHDVLMSGDANGSASLAALRSTGAEWAASRQTTAMEAAAIDAVLADEHADLLGGCSGADWFVISATDLLTDLSQLGKKSDGDVVTRVS